MRYQAPYGQPDPNAGYQNGNPAQGQQGSIPPAAAFEQPMRELENLIAKSYQTPSDANLLQLTHGVRSQRLNYAEDNGTANNLIVAYDPPITEYRAGLTLHVRVKFTNTSDCQINAGPGNARIRKMNSADINPGELPAGCIATLIHDGTAFQLSNFGGGGTGQGDTYTVNIPYCIDQSATPGTIIANFNPAIDTVNQGDIIAVNVANTAPGPTEMIINGLPAIELLPNGGGQMLQGDVVANDVVQFFYDGVSLRFMPNPEMNAPVTYTVGAGQQFADVAEAMDALKRKVIGQSGFVTLQLSAGLIVGPIDVAHPSGDRIAIVGTMIGPNPVWSEFAAAGNSSAQRDQDAFYNANYLRARFGTEIQVIDHGGVGNQADFGIRNSGAGTVTFRDLLITSTRPPVNPPGVDPFYWVFGVISPLGGSVSCVNVSVFGCHLGWTVQGSGQAVGCFAVACTWGGFSISGNWASRDCAALGSEMHGYYATLGGMFADRDRSLMNGGYGFMSNNSGGMDLWYISATGNDSVNGIDLMANAASTIVVYMPSTFGATSPPQNVFGGNQGSVVVVTTGNLPA
jgi:hypothetical protein